MNNNIYFGGATTASSNISTIGAFQTTINSTQDCYLVKLSSTGSRIWATYYGGNGDVEELSNICVDTLNNIYVIGGTNSTNVFNSSGAYQTTNNGQIDAFLAKFNSSGNRMWGTFFGGSKDDAAGGICLPNKKSIVIVGFTYSDSNIATSNAFQTIYGGGGDKDGFIACFDSTGHFTPDGINDLNHQTASLIKVYPNPAKDKITVSIKDDAGKGGSLLLTDIEGKVVRSVVVKSQENNIDMKELTAGVYLLEYNNGEVCETVKVVKE